MLWITSGRENDAKNSLPPELFRKKIAVCKPVKAAVLKATALGIYEVNLNGNKVGKSYFTPGYTCYEQYVQLQEYDLTELIAEGENTLDITVANGWWLGQLGDKNNRFGTKRALTAELVMQYEDGTEEVIGTDETWCVTQDTPVRYGDFYGGETIDLRNCDEAAWVFAPAQEYKEKTPEIKPGFGVYVTEDGVLKAEQLPTGIYDFKQNHAGVVCLTVKAAKGTKIIVKHAEILKADGSLFTENLRTAAATLTLICGEDGINAFHPRYTYMGFRYVDIQADAPIEIVELISTVLTSDCEKIGTFSCSEPLINRLQENVQWGQASNFMDIPTDCPQRDERMGWTGDIAVFSQTAAYNRNIQEFMRKWLTDVRCYQRENGALPVTIPANPTYEPLKEMGPTAIWGDCATMVPWAVYRAYGDLSILEDQYESMKKFVECELSVASVHDFPGHKQYLWDLNAFQYGDWCAPGEDFMAWQNKAKYLSTSFMGNSVRIVKTAAELLGKTEDAAHYGEILDKILAAFDKYIVKDGSIFEGDFQSNYACALYFDMVKEEKRPAAAARLAQLVRENDYKIATGFAGTPYVLFALADGGYVEEAYKLLMNEECPGWMYTVIAGGTTTWERWDALSKDGSIRADAIPDMISFNHYAYGAVGDFFYRRILGLEPVTGGYGHFAVAPVPGKLKSAQGSLKTSYGTIEISWQQDEKFSLTVKVPEGTECDVVLPNGEKHAVESGTHEFCV